MMTYLNKYHRVVVLKELRKIAKSMKSPMNSEDAANYMKRNFKAAKKMQARLISVEIDTYISAVGLTETDTGRYEDQEYSVGILLPRNVLRVGRIYIIDTEITKKK